MGRESLPPFVTLQVYQPQDENIWAVRITRGYRAVGVLEGDTVTWFWVGNHDDYERFFS